MDIDRIPIDEHLLAQLLPSIATQIRTALGGIYFAAAALASPEARERDESVDAAAAVLDQNYYRLLRLANNLSSAAYLHESSPAQLRDQDLVEIVRHVCEQSEFLVELLGLRLTFCCREESHLCAVFQGGVEHLLFELLSNAMKFTPRGGSITVDLRFLRGQAQLSVEDTGCGISEDRLPTLFDRYLHGNQMDPPPHGVGLGLPLCRHIAAEHGGTIIAESRVGQGTRVVLSIPYHQTGVSALSDVPFDYAGGFNHTLLALSDALPPAAFQLNNQD